MLWFILPAFLTTRIWEQTTMGLACPLALANTWVALHNIHSTVLQLTTLTQRCRFYSNISFPISRSYLYFCSQTTYFFRGGRVTKPMDSAKVESSKTRFSGTACWALHKLFTNKQFRDFTRMFQGNDRLEYSSKFICNNWMWHGLCRVYLWECGSNEAGSFLTYEGMCMIVLSLFFLLLSSA